MLMGAFIHGDLISANVRPLYCAESANDFAELSANFKLVQSWPAVGPHTTSKRLSWFHA
jgi:hypothetical protein